MAERQLTMGWRAPAASIYTAEGFLEPKTGELTVPGTPIKIILADIFAELEKGL